MELPHYRLSLDMFYDVQHNVHGQPGGASPTAFWWEYPDRLHTNEGRKSVAWYNQRKAEGCYLAFVQRDIMVQEISGEFHPLIALGLFAADGTRLETLYSECRIDRLHAECLFFAGQGVWGTVVLPTGRWDWTTQPIPEPLGHQHTGAEYTGCVNRPSIAQIGGWLEKHRVLKPWSLVRQLVKARAIFFYWLELTVKHQMGEGGAQRARDKQEFEADATDAKRQRST